MPNMKLVQSAVKATLPNTVLNPANLDILKTIRPAQNALKRKPHATAAKLWSIPVLTLPEIRSETALIAQTTSIPSILVSAKENVLPIPVQDCANAATRNFLTIAPVLWQAALRKALVLKA